jgi:hypothetical protein
MFYFRCISNAVDENENEPLSVVHSLVSVHELQAFTRVRSESIIFSLTFV